jgi:hypothetical protein
MLATNTARLGFGPVVRNHDSLAATDAKPTGLTPRRRTVGILPFRSRQPSIPPTLQALLAGATLTVKPDSKDRTNGHAGR